MGKTREIANIETEENDYKVEMWRGSGRTSTGTYPNPARLYKNTNSGWSIIEEWSANYGKNRGPRKTPNQVLAEALKKMRFYDDSPLGTIEIEDVVIDARDHYVYFFQPSIETENVDYELYRLGASKISERYSQIEVEKEDIREKAKSPYEILIFEDGEVTDRIEKEEV